MSAVVLKSMNGFDLSEADLASLATEITAVLAGVEGGDSIEVDVAVSPMFGTGNAMFDTLVIVVPTLDLIKELAYGKLVDVAIEFMKRRFNRRHEESRPRRITIVGAIDPDHGLQIKLENISSDTIEIRVMDGRRALE